MTSQIWQPAAEAIEDSVLIERISTLANAGLTPCAPDLLSMLGRLSQRILKSRVARQTPQYVALAYWLRPAALARLAGELNSCDRPGLLRTPRGIALHLPPTNVDTIFVYSWAMSVLAGNANIVRLAESLNPNTCLLYTSPSPRDS